MPKFGVVENPPNIVNQAVSFTNSVFKHVMNGFQTTSDEKREARLKICGGCEFFNNKNPNSPNCMKCGCFLNTKTAWASEKCPIDKWGPELPDVSSNCGSCNKT